MGELVTFASNGETASGYLARPASGAGKGVIVIQEWWGLNANIKGIADRFAAEGFVALAPDMYHGVVASEPDEAGKLLMALNIARAEQDLKGAVAYLKALTGGPVGTVGFCMGGALALFAACNSNGDVAACIDFYGGHPMVKYNWDGLTAPLLGIWAEHDGFVNPNIPAYEAALKERGKAYEFITYPGTQHAFFNDEHPEPEYNPAAAKDAWEKSLAFYRRHL
ncbi:MAG: dienelactone hydrolase family protein [Dehalococcoidia bacterium]|uniref:dienelactone hydrolase family protein n=1 Tax=Candidatus Amarobacter glycogenicus TaxID=3140699 RepID=UPI003135FF96|nr:dienelactone hydrolase family protein [Dehalococcoidia bacterium]MBK7328970.1 dienelactone hydrolase family protein [Dehalococcoidia bacterium]